MKKARFQLPTAEDDLWEQVVLALLAQRNIHDREVRDHLRLLEELGFQKQFCHKRLTQTFVLNTATWLAEEMKLLGPGDKARKWLADLESWELLIPRGHGNDVTYEFPIPGLDEYFAARHLAARWREDDKRYRKWLPCKDGWWEKAEEMTCPNPCCEFPLPLFRDVLRRAEYEETLLLTVGLLKDAEREQIFLNEIDDLNLWFKMVSRCRYVHGSLAEKLDHRLRMLGVGLDAVKQGLSALRSVRNGENGEAILAFFYKLVLGRQGQRLGHRRWAAYCLAYVGNDVASRLLTYALKFVDWREDREEWKVSQTVIDALVQMGNPAVARLIQLIRVDNDAGFRLSAVDALGRIGDPVAVPTLQELLDGPHDGVRDAVQRALEQIEHRRRSR